MRATVVGVIFLGMLAPVLAAAAPCKLGKIFEFPITMTEMGPLTTAKVNGADVRFMVDSGAFWSVISPASAAELKLQTYLAPFGFYMVGLGGARTDVSLAKVKDFSLAGFTFHNVDFLIGGSQVDAGIGVLGQNVLHFAKGDVEYDLGQGVVRVMKPVDCARDVKLAYWTANTTYSDLKIEPITRAAPHAIGRASINGAEIRVMFDSGSGLSMLSLRAAARAGIRPDSPGVVAGGPAYGFGKVTIPTFIAPFASFKLGEEEIRHTRLRIADIDLQDADMLIGADFFLSHRIYVANSQSRVYFTYNGGPVFNLEGARYADSAPGTAAPGTAAPAPSASTPGDGAASAPGAASSPSQASTAVTEGGGDAGDFSRRGAAMASRRDYGHALIALSRACDLAPGNPEYFYQRGIVYWQMRDSASAVQDLNQALKLKPDHLAALLARAELSLQQGDKARMMTDLEAADAAAAKQADMRYDMAALYEQADLWNSSIAQYNLWIDAHPDDARLPFALNSRCWARAVSAHDLELALKDCNAALKRASKGSEFYARVANSRGLVWLRMGNYDKSIADYDAAIKINPKDASSWYVRGIDELRVQRRGDGEADIAQAEALAPTVAEKHSRRGIAP